MPPLRTFQSVKPLKTERTHEENQERAYIAASRRSDRSLEARVESARRASEIHKRRTGRSLRVTEQDVINEEMYEEEDDDIPSQYRRLTAHLQTGSAEFNRRLQTYLANHVAMRTALNDAIHNNFSQHYPNAPQFAHNTGGGFPSPLVTQSFPPPEPMRSPQAVSPHTPHAYRAAPYSIQGRPGYRQQQQQQQQVQAPMRTASLSSQPQMMTPGVHPSSIRDSSLMNRRMSMPVAKVERPDVQSAQKAPSLPADDVELAESKSDTGFASTSPTPESMRGASVQGQGRMDPGQQRAKPGNIPNFPRQNSYGPFSMVLPMESQQLVNPASLPQDDFGAALMAGSETWMYGSAGLSASNPGEMLKPDSNFYPNTVGMNSTLLAPEFGSIAPTTMSSDKLDMNATAPVQGLDFGQFLDFSGSSSSNPPSGVGTPASDSQAWKELVESGWVEGANAT